MCRLLLTEEEIFCFKIQDPLVPYYKEPHLSMDESTPVCRSAKNKLAALVNIAVFGSDGVSLPPKRKTPSPVRLEAFFSMH